MEKGEKLLVSNDESRWIWTTFQSNQSISLFLIFINCYPSSYLLELLPYVRMESSIANLNNVITEHSFCPESRRIQSFSKNILFPQKGALNIFIYISGKKIYIKYMIRRQPFLLARSWKREWVQRATHQ